MHESLFGATDLLAIVLVMGLAGFGFGNLVKTIAKRWLPASWRARPPLNCPICLSFWSSFFAAGIWVGFPSAYTLLFLSLAAAVGLATFLFRWVEWTEPEWPIDNEVPEVEKEANPPTRES